MPINAGSVRPGHCYAAARVVLKVVDVQGDIITYVVRDNLAFPTWDKKKWRTAILKTFAHEVAREVPCDWERD